MPIFGSMSFNGKGKKASPDKPVLAYTADGQFTISNYNSAYFYTVTGATRSGNILSSVSDGATINVSWASGAPLSTPSTMNVAANARVLDQVMQTFSSAGCGPRPNSCCSSPWIMDINGTTCGGSPGTQGAFAECGTSCPGNCYGYFNVQCWSWHWTDYTSSGYILIGNTWGKAS